jgi:integrase
MASITERNGRFLVRVRREGFPTVTKTFTRRSDGAAWARRVEADMESGRWQAHPAAVPTLRAVIQEYRKVIAPKMKGATTYRYRFDEFERLPFAVLRISDVPVADLARWRDEQLSLFRPGTVARKLAMLSSMFNWAQKERGWLTQNPLAQIRRPRADDSRTRTLSGEEVDWLMQAARTSKATWLPAALTILMLSAMRRGELFSLRREDLSFEAGVAHLRDTKNGSPRDVPLCPQAIAALRTLSGQAEREGRAFLLPLGSAGSLSTRFVVTVKRARALYEAACESCGKSPAPGFLEDLRLHDLRHHAVTQLAQTGAFSTVELMAISGHKTTKMLVRYTHLQASALAAKLGRLKAVGRAQCPGLDLPGVSTN